MSNADSGNDFAELGSPVGASLHAPGLPQAGGPSRRIASDAGAGGIVRSWRVSVLRAFILALLLLPGRVSLSNSVPTSLDTSIPKPHTRVIPDEPLAADCLAHLDHSGTRSTRYSEKCPAALRKHSRRPSPSDDDGTRPDPTDEDDSSNNLINDGTEAAIVPASPAMICFLIASDDVLSPFALPRPTSLFLVLQRFRC